MTFSVTPAELSLAKASAYDRAKAHVNLQLLHIKDRVQRNDPPWGGDGAYRIVFIPAIPVTPDMYQRLTQELCNEGFNASLRKESGSDGFPAYPYIAIQP